ncbi:hypothetical protein Zm00014a_006872 [Zea mays]|uniref:Uncharacterized protein n=1 Tax=Zea mays TaxID=4577 RepID=A0A317YFN3_MAIZE|nr:hypothetical protein Zm00014a_006872 [Zea mays]
MHYNNNKAF